MNKPISENDWPASWATAYAYDQEEVFSEIRTLGYAYAYQNRQAATFALIKSHVPTGGSILDVAAAQGNFSLLLAEQGYKVTWNDLRGDLVDYVKLKHQSGDVSYAVGDVFKLGFEACFDAVLITEIIEHVAHPDEFLRKIAAMVKPGGHIIMTTPNGAYFLNKLPRFSECPDPSVFESMQFKPNSDGHIFLLWPDETRALGENAGLVVLDQRLFTTPLTNGHIKTGRILRIIPRGWVFILESLAKIFPHFIRARIMAQTALCYRR
jgi:2-polyprenyl-3-methyl-5-hydroxy-6-metoxy-1,4-benzoquinol methylase